MTQIGTIFSSPTNPYCLLLTAFSSLITHYSPAYCSRNFNRNERKGIAKLRKEVFLL